MTVLLDVQHGSHLYGLARPDSDHDRYVVLQDRPASGRGRYRWASQKIEGGVDILTTDLHTFLDMAQCGVPQALEAMFARHADVDVIGALRRSWRASGGVVLATYRRTIVNFAIVGDLKRRRHALRLSCNLRSIMETGRFDPLLPPQTVERISAAAQESPRYYLMALRELCPLELRVKTDDIAPL